MCIRDRADSVHFDPDLWIVSGQNLVLKLPVAVFDDRERSLIYPNPATDDAWLHVGGRMSGEVRLEVIDALGRMVIEANPVVEDLRVPVLSGPLSPGHYTVRVVSSDGARIELPFIKG